MDWCIDRSPTTIRRLRGEIRGYLERHGCAEPGEVQAAEVAVSELLANAYEHGAGPIWVSLEWTGRFPLLSVHDLGRNFELGVLVPPDHQAIRGRGLWIVSQFTTELRAAAKRAGGTVVSARLPVPRRQQRPTAPPRRSINPLPPLDEAGPDGFGKESFLRALVVQLAAAVEDQHGPQAAEDSVAQVGADMGGQLETEYRFAHAVFSRWLTAEQIADCCVRVKQAIGGEFFVIEVTEDRIVLGSSRCPFGDAVVRSPSLCRMTSSVFGGIGARNTGSATVELQERIAVGDPGCRIVISLGSDPGQDGHYYPSAESVEGCRSESSEERSTQV